MANFSWETRPWRSLFGSRLSSSWWKEQNWLSVAALCDGRQKSSFAYFGQFFRALKALVVSPCFPWGLCHEEKRSRAAFSRALRGDAAPSPRLSQRVWALCTYVCLGMRVAPSRAGSARQGEAIPLRRPRLLPLAPEEGEIWPWQKSLRRQTSPREEFNFSFFQSFFRDHKYLWRACQSFLGFLTECVTREGLLWGFIVNCSKLYSCQGAERSYTMSGESKQSPQYGNDAVGWTCPCPRGHHEACALLKCHFSPQTSARHGQEKLLLLGQKSQQTVNRFTWFLHGKILPLHKTAMHTSARY